VKKELLLKKHFGYSGFLPGQKELIDHICRGEDALGIMPTGGGKSMCYQLPAMIFEGVTLVVSPLISLMKDQVQAMVEDNIPAAYINSALSESQTKTAFQYAREGRYKIIYIAPERLVTAGFNHLARELSISLVAVDEAHCVSQWGQNFRPSYLAIKAFIDGLPKRPVVAAFTATATKKVREDIVKLLGLQKPFVMVTGFDRPNLYFDVRSPRDRLTALADYIETNRDRSGIVYCLTRKDVEAVCAFLCAKGIGATRYHAGLEPEERSANQEDFIYDRRPVMVATNAFGMGIDKSNVSYVLHYGMPKDLESYYQEAGRAGRDGMDAECILFFSRKDILTNQFLINNREDNKDLDAQTQERIRAHEHLRLRRMIQYAATTDCLRKFILDYFGESMPDGCGRCGNCDADFEETDVTERAQIIMSCIHRMGQRYGTKLVVDTLLGRRNEKVRQLGLEAVKTYGRLKGADEDEVRAVIDHLMLYDYIGQTDDEYPVLKLTPMSRRVLLDGEQVLMRRKQAAVEKARKDEPADKPLLNALKELRLAIAKEKRVPAFVVFSDATLADMSRKKPQSREEFLAVSGVGPAKLAQYGEAFLEKIRSCGPY
jgi:ATP-dependent DNA helicase RecQ